MFQTLLESRARRARRTGGTAISIGVHTAVIAMAVAATARATSSGARTQPSDPRVTFVNPVPHRGSPRPLPLGARPGAPVLDHVRLNLSTDLRLPSFEIQVPIRWPGDRPAQGPVEPLGTGVLGESLDGRTSPDNIYTAPMVDKAVVPRSGNPAPVYPGALRAAQVEGSVVARFIVDTTGRAEPASITFPESTHPDFATAVRQALLRSRYLPAVVAGRPVRQLVEQRFAFTIQR